MTLYHDGPIECYEVRDSSVGEVATFSDFKAADLQFTNWSLDTKRTGHLIEFVAVIAS